MPVVQKVGPDGCLYILDWYDRYHCYQDANADPAGIEREKGRLYRVVYKGHENKKAEDLGAKSDDELIVLLGDSNVYNRTTASRLLGERAHEATADKLKSLVLARETPRTKKIQAIGSISVMGAVSNSFLSQLIQLDDRGPYSDEILRGWAVRLGGDNPKAFSYSLYDLFLEAPFDRSLVVRRNLAAWQQKVPLASLSNKPEDKQQASWDMNALSKILTENESDQMLAHVVWQKLLPLIKSSPQDAVYELFNSWTFESPEIEPILERAIPVLCERRSLDGGELGRLISDTIDSEDASEHLKNSVVQSLNQALRQGQLSPQQREELHASLKKANHYLDERPAIAISMTLLGDEDAMNLVRRSFNDSKATQNIRLESLQALVSAKAPNIVKDISDSIGGTNAPKEFRIKVIEAIGGVNDPEIGKFLVDNYPTWEGDVKPRVIEVLTQRDSWSISLLEEIKAEKINKDVVNLNQLKRVASFKNDELQDLLTKVYGQIRADQRSDRQHIINQQRDFLNGTPGDPHKGIAIFKKVCGQCHKMYGEGAEVGPDITRNGRSNWNQLLQNVFDPSAVIGPGYQARQLATEDGRILTGLPIEESDERVVLKIQGGKIETIPRDKIEAYKVSEVSMMPEDLEKQLKPQELADLFAYLALDRPPSDPAAKILSGAPNQKVRD